MNIIFTGTNHSKEDEDIEVILEYNDKDTWTLKLPAITFTISDLSIAMDFLERDYCRVR